MASPSLWTWVWVNFSRWWRTGKPGVLQCIGLQRVRHEWVTESTKEQIVSSAFRFFFFFFWVIPQWWDNFELHFSDDNVGEVHNFIGSVSLQEKFEATDRSVLHLCMISSGLSCCRKNLKWQTDQCYSFVLQLSFIWQAKENISLRREGKQTQKTRSEEESPLNFGFSFYVIFSSPWACTM